MHKKFNNFIHRLFCTLLANKTDIVGGS